jgi:hypothetical protein
VSDEATPDEAVEESEGTVIEVPLTLEGEAERQDLHCLCECRKVLHEVYTGENAEMIYAVEHSIVIVAKAIGERYQGQS